MVMRIPSALTPSMSNQVAGRCGKYRAAGLVFMALLSGLGMAAARAEGLSIERLAVPGDIKSIASESGRVVVTSWTSERFAVVGGPGARRLEAISAPAPFTLLPSGALPDAVVGRGERNIAAAWLAAPTERYGHGVIGDAVEAGALVARLPSGVLVRLTLPTSSVFEDRLARIVDADGDGEDEVIAVHSYLDRGAALAVIGLVDGGLQIIAETPPIGRANRWLNPIGVGDFDGDGRPEIAYVETPHIGGVLLIYRLQGARLVKLASAHGFSNHASGSFQLDLALIMDMNGDGVVDMVLPDNTRTRLRVMTAEGGRLREIASASFAVQIAFGFHTLAPGEFVLGLAGGEIAIVSAKL